MELYWNTRVSAAGVSCLGRSCPALTHLNLSGCKNVGNAGLMALAATGGGKLEFLDLTRCPGLTDQAITAIVSANKGLRCLNLYATAETLSDSTCAAIGRSLPHLRLLDLCGAKEITDEVRARRSPLPFALRPLARLQSMLELTTVPAIGR